MMISAKAEYRVFELQITTAPKESTTNPTTDETTKPDINRAPASESPPSQKTVLSTLDPIQYQGYFPLQDNETIKYTATWRCRGRTDGYKPLCPNPKAAATATDTKTGATNP